MYKIEMKNCSSCDIKLPNTEEYFSKSPFYDKLIPQCKKCVGKKKKEWNKKNYKKERGKQLERKYGLSLIDFNIKLRGQDYKCAICGKSFFDKKIKYDEACLDHNHKTGGVRGILCRTCNSGLGFFKEDRRILCEAIRYLHLYKNI